MYGLNKVMLLGYLGADLDLRMTAGGTALLKLRLATTESYLDKNSQRQERTEWHSVCVWGKRGEALSKFLTKGERVFVEGGIRTSSYDKDGQKHYRTEIMASEIILCGKGRSGGQKATGERGVSPESGHELAPAEDFGDYPPAGDELPF